MADESSDSGDNTTPAPERGSRASSPRWWRVFVFIAIFVVVLFVILLLTGGHGPGRHTSSGAPANQMPASRVVKTR